MLNYELCKKLKEAGLPQIVKPFDQTWIGENSIEIKIPTLEELIEAVGGGFISVGRNPFPREEGWMASAYANSVHSTGKNAFGNSAEEAVANLYPALAKYK